MMGARARILFTLFCGGKSLIEVRSLSKRYGAFTAVDGLSFSIQPGEVVGFLGPNGAGKTTTMRMIAGFLPPSAGEIRLCGVDVTQNRLAAQSHLGYLPEGAPAWPDMTPEGLLRFTADARGWQGAERLRRVETALERLELRAVRHQPIDTLSKGFKRRVGLAQAILHEPPVILMDEPTDGLDPNQKQEVRKLIRSLAGDGRRTIMLSTHILEEVGAVCTRALVVARGRLAADETPEGLVKRHGSLERAFHELTLPGNPTKEAA
jgi:ABC-2 type transport system ATP-binding protein